MVGDNFPLKRGIFSPIDQKDGNFWLWSLFRVNKSHLDMTLNCRIIMQVTVFEMIRIRLNEEVDIILMIIYWHSFVDG